MMALLELVKLLSFADLWEECTGILLSFINYSVSTEFGDEIMSRIMSIVLGQLLELALISLIFLLHFLVPKVKIVTEHRPLRSQFIQLSFLKFLLLLT